MATRDGDLRARSQRALVLTDEPDLWRDRMLPEERAYDAAMHAAIMPELLALLEEQTRRFPVADVERAADRLAEMEKR